jgi:hypothetical protein
MELTWSLSVRRSSASPAYSKWRVLVASDRDTEIARRPRATRGLDPDLDGHFVVADWGGRAAAKVKTIRRGRSIRSRKRFSRYLAGRSALTRVSAASWAVQERPTRRRCLGLGAPSKIREIGISGDSFLPEDVKSR